MTGILELIVAGAISFLFGGGAVTLYKAHAENKVRHAEAADLGAKTGVQVTDLSVDTLVKVNTQLTEDYARVKRERDDYCERFERLRAEVDELREKLQQMTDIANALKHELDTLSPRERRTEVP